MFSTYDKEMWGIRAVFTHIVNMVCTVWKGKYLSNTLYIIHKCLHTNGSQFLKCSNANETSYYFTHKKTAQKVSFLTYDLTKVFRTLANVDYVAKHFIKPSLILCYILLQIHFSPFPYASSWMKTSQWEGLAFSLCMKDMKGFFSEKGTLRAVLPQLWSQIIKHK